MLPVNSSRMEIRRDFNERLRLSVHYASTPTLNHENHILVNHSATNSVEENSVHSDDLELTSTSSHHSGHPSPPPHDKSHYLPSNVSVSNVSVSSYASSNSNKNHFQRQRLASVSSSRLSSLQAFPVRNNHVKSFAPVVPPKPVKKPVTNQVENSSSDDDLSVTDEDVRAIETCYRGNKTQFVFVCQSLANLYQSPRASTRLDPGSQADNWKLTYTGIPVLLLDTSSASHVSSAFSRSKAKNAKCRQIQILLVEKGTCFVLWRDIIDNLSKYQEFDHLFHVMHLSTDHLSRIGLSFDSAKAAGDLFNCVQMLTSDPYNISLSGPGRKSNGQDVNETKSKKTVKFRKPSKTEISLPCGFQHVVSVGQEDTKKYFSMQAYVQRWRQENEQRRSQRPKLALYNSCTELNV